MRIDHVEVALVDGHVHRLAHGAAGVVHRRRHVGELDQVLEILELGVAAPVLDIVNEGGPVDRREDEVAPAHLDRALGVTRDLGEGGGCGRDQVACEPARKAHPLAVDVGAGTPEQVQRLGVLAEIDPDLLEDRLRVLLQQSEPLLAQQVDRGNVARDVAQMLDLAAGPLRAPGGASAAAAPASLRPGLAVVWLCRHFRDPAVARAWPCRPRDSGRGQAAALSEFRPKNARPRQTRRSPPRRGFCDPARAGYFRRLPCERGSDAMPEIMKDESAGAAARPLPSHARGRRDRRRRGGLLDSLPPRQVRLEGRDPAGARRAHRGLLLARGRDDPHALLGPPTFPACRDTPSTSITRSRRPRASPSTCIGPAASTWPPPGNGTTT